MSENRIKHKCSVPGCGFYMETRRYNFPKIESLKKQWLKALNMKSCGTKSIVCEKHFLKWQMYTLPGYSENNAKHRLIRNVIPQKMFTINSHVTVSIPMGPR